MTTTELKADTGATAANRTGVYLAVLQLVFTLGWTTYVIYLPKLAAEVGIAPTLALAKVERDIADEPTVKTAQPAKPLGGVPIFFIASMLILSLGYQLHFSINSGPFYLRFAQAADLPWLMPVFWIGFNIAMFPASVVVKHRGGLIVMGAAGLLGAELAGNLHIMIAAQFLAGAAWGCMLMAAVSAALAIGETGAEGKVVGLVFSALALATFGRMAAVAGGLKKLPEYARRCCNGHRSRAGRLRARGYS